MEAAELICYIPNEEIARDRRMCSAVSYVADANSVSNAKVNVAFAMYISRDILNSLAVCWRNIASWFQPMVRFPIHRSGRVLENSHLGTSAEEVDIVEAFICVS